MVVSAPGKRFDGDDKVTDLLINVAQRSCPLSLHSVLMRFWQIISDLGLNTEVFENIKNDLLARLALRLKLTADRFLDLIITSGEDITAKLAAAYFISQGVSAAYINPAECGLILSDKNKKIKFCPSSYKRLSSISALDKIVVFPGFFGANKNGEIIAFDRGGSDITGAILAASLNACLYENYTDVNGVYAACPMTVNSPIAVPQITYQEMECLARGGFNVLHQDALAPLARKQIPLIIKNAAGFGNETLVTKYRDVSKCPIAGIAGKILRRKGVLTVAGEGLPSDASVRAAAALKTANIHYSLLTRDKISLTIHVPPTHVSTAVNILYKCFFL